MKTIIIQSVIIVIIGLPSTVSSRSHIKETTILERLNICFYEEKIQPKYEILCLLVNDDNGNKTLNKIQSILKASDIQCTAVGSAGLTVSVDHKDIEKACQLLQEAIDRNEINAEVYKESK